MNLKYFKCVDSLSQYGLHDKQLSGRFIWASLNLFTRKAQGRADGRGGLEEQGRDGLRYYGLQAKEAE